MSTQSRTNANSSSPVSSHPLFPAIVALWFGALFGLGSLAVRPSLIESLVISSHLDVIVPMAAPPLGMTARILLALFMAMIGIATGAAIARRVARPKPVSPNRRRTAASVSEARKADFVRQVQTQQVEQQTAADKADAVRRRALASEEEHYSRSHRDEMPLPGSAHQILDVTQFDLGAPGSFEADLEKEAVAAAPLDLTGFAAPQAAFDAPVDADALVEPEPAKQAEIEPANIPLPAPVAESYGDDTNSFRAKFGNDTKHAEWTPEPPASYPDTCDTTEVVDNVPDFVAEATDVAVLRRFDAPPLEAKSQPQGQTDFASKSTDRFAPDEVSDSDLANPEVSAELESAATADVPGLLRFDVSTSVPLSGPVLSPADFADDHPSASEVSEPASASDVDSPSLLRHGNAADRIATAELAELSPVELVERFALALKQRRHAGAFPAGLLETAAAFDLPVGPQPSQVPEVLAAMAPFEPVAAQAPEASVAPQAPAAAPPLFAEGLLDSLESDDAPIAAMRLPLALPVAMRPIEFGQHEEHDDLPNYAPPRSIAMPRPAEVTYDAEMPAAPELPAIPVQADDKESQVAAYAESAIESPAELDVEAGVSEEAYSSLLAVTRTAPLRQTFVRIEEPDSELANVEPVVIFPGQATRPGTRFARPSENAPLAEPEPEAPQSPMELSLAAAPGLRRFDAPTGVAPVPPGTGVAQDPAESERALRSALATLQRMSGAA